MNKPTYDQWQAIESALERAISLRESSEGGGHALLIQLLRELGYTPMSSQEAERVAQRVIDAGYKRPVRV